MRTQLDTPSAPAAIGPYTVAVEAAGLVFISGQVAFDPASGEKLLGTAESETRQIMENIGAILRDVGLGFDDIVKTTIFLTDMGDYATVNAVYGDYVGASPPARSAVQVAALPAGFHVEIELIAAR